MIDSTPAVPRRLSLSDRFPMGSMLVGLGVAQLLATYFVRLSNMGVLETTHTLSAAGWLAIPSGPAATLLNSFSAAFYGGLFFTFSIGLLLTLIGWSWAKILKWIGPHQRHRLAIGSSSAWSALSIAIFLHCTNVFLTVLMLSVPLTTLWADLKWVPNRQPTPERSPWVIPTLVLLLFIAVGTTHVELSMFSTLRDRWLLSNPMGRVVNDLYYRHTLSAAELLKPLSQKTVRTVRLENFDGDEAYRKLMARLARVDLLVVSDPVPVDLRIVREGDRIALITANNSRLYVDGPALQRNPRLWLQKISDISDRSALLRQLSFWGLVIGMPCFVYYLLHEAIQWVIARCGHRRRASFWASLACLMVVMVGIVFSLYETSLSQHSPSPSGLNETLGQSSWKLRVEALRQITRQKMDLIQLPNHQRLIDSPMVVERYWLARALASSQSQESYALLLSLMDDPHPNVVCQAFYALGYSNRPEAIALIREKIVRSDHWYIQWYGYRAMQELGWRQIRSK